MGVLPAPGRQLKVVDANVLLYAVSEDAPQHHEARQWLDGTLGGVGGNLTNDAHLAALAVAHRGVVISYDSDFGRFAGVRWSTPA